MDTRAILEPFAEGKEFTVIILQNKLGLPDALIPSEIELAYHEGRIFDFRKKYLPTNQVKYHCPARFPESIIEKIQTEAKQLFSLFGMKEFARFDGWLLSSGEIWFSDFNPISGMEQNSFLFQQASRIGMSHGDLLHYIVRNSCLRQRIKFSEFERKNIENKKPVPVLFGGKTSERQVSLMTGTNVWLKLRKSNLYKPKPYLLDFENNIWELPYALILNHTVEEIITNAKDAQVGLQNTENIVRKVQTELLLKEGEATEPFFVPKQISFEDFINQVNKSEFVFLGLHGGDGENGNFQKMLSERGIRFNGSDEATSHLCMALNTKTIIVKPKDDGCSTGVVHLYRDMDLKNYLLYLMKKENFIPAGILRNQASIIEMPSSEVREILFEKFIRTDSIHFKGNKLKYTRKDGWIEVTIGLLEENKKLSALNPSLTIAEGEVLSVEEKFQGGTGINITPPPISIIKPKIVLKTRELAQKLGEKIGIKGYARLDAFMNTRTGALIIIEVNTLPALTPSTVIYHQALTEKPPIYPLQLLEKIIQNAGY